MLRIAALITFLFINTITATLADDTKAVRIRLEPTGSVSSTNVQDAIAELDSDKVPTSTTVNGQPLSSNVTITTISGNAGTASAFDHTPTQCNSGYFPRGIDSVGNAQNCSQINSATWGSITGTLSSQSDLQTALNAKQNTITTGTTAQYFKGDLSLGTFPTAVSSFTNDSGYLTSETDGIIGNEITNAADSSLTRTGSGTSLSPYLLAINLANSNSWTGQQTFLTSPPIFATMSQGSVLFAGSGGVLSQDSSGYNYDDATNSLFVYLSQTERISNGNFTGGSSGWSLASGWTYSSNAVSHSSNGTGVLSQSPTNFYVGGAYQLTYTISALTAGTVTPTVGGKTLTQRNANGTYSERFISTNTSALVFTPSNTARFTIDSISLVELTSGDVFTGKHYGQELILSKSGDSNYSPGTTRHITLNNGGSYSYIDGMFGTQLKAALGFSSSGDFRMFASGGKYFNFFAGTTSPSLIAYLYPTAFVHSTGYGAFLNGIRAGSTASPTSTLQSDGGTALKTKYVYANQTLDNTATKIVCDASAASCTGTPSTTSCSTYLNSTTCNNYDAHGGCTWFAGNDCSAFNHESGMSTCISTTGCSASTSNCSDSGWYDQTSCEAADDAYGGSCTYNSSSNDCSVFSDEMTCTEYSSCSWYPDSYSDCSSFNGNQVSCETTMGCSWSDPDCSGSYLSTAAYCSGSYETTSCDGTFNSGACTGMYGASCTGTATCSGIDDSINCGNETGCSWATAVTLTLPSVSSVEPRDYWVENDSSSGSDCTLIPTGSDTVNSTSSYTLSNYKDSVHVSAFRKTTSCSPYNEATCNSYSSNGCSSAYNNCSYDSMSGDCTGHASCSSYNGSQESCESATYYSYCAGTHILKSDWYVFSDKKDALTSITASSPLTGGTITTSGAIGCQTASGSQAGCLSSSDWSTFNGKQSSITGAATSITSSNLTASRALVSDGSGKVSVSSTTSTELGYLSGVTSAIQTQFSNVGQYKVSTASPSAVSSFTISSLSSSKRYLLVWDLTQNTSNGDITFYFNAGGAGTSNGVSLYGGTTGAGVPATYTTTGNHSLNLGDTTKSGTPNKGYLYFNTDSGNVVTAIGQAGVQAGSNSYYYVSSIYHKYSGSSTLSSMTFATSAGTLTGTAKLYELN